MAPECVSGATARFHAGNRHFQPGARWVVEEAEGKRAHAVIAFGFDTSEPGGIWTEICAYGTAVKVSRAE
jgi:Putative heavy-metal-binding